jgi:transcriptional regulator with XRE-family HTH domain
MLVAGITTPQHIIEKGDQELSHPVDVQVGKRIRQRRFCLKITQQQLSSQVGVKFQQIQKYETGKNRVSASRLWDISNVLDVPVSFFFDGLDAKSKDGTAKSDLPFDIVNEPEAFNLLRAYYSIPDAQRPHLFQLTRALGEAT